MSTNQYVVRQQTRHTTALDTTTSMTDVLCYHTVIITTTLVVDESPGIYPTVEGCGVPGPFLPKLLLLRHRRTDSTQYVLPFGTTTFWSSGSPNVPSNLSPYQPTKRYTGGSDRCASTTLNSYSVEFAMYPFSKCPFALLMCTRSASLKLRVPTLS